MYGGRTAGMFGYSHFTGGFVSLLSFLSVHLEIPHSILDALSLIAHLLSRLEAKLNTPVYHTAMSTSSSFQTASQMRRVSISPMSSLPPGTACSTLELISRTRSLSGEPVMFT